MGNYGPAITRHTSMPTNPTTMPGLWQTPPVPSLITAIRCDHMNDYISHIAIMESDPPIAHAAVGPGNPWNQNK